ncbi:MAG TPA: ASPIC/UnbV domain-containing protein, partial [Candidatus Eisenbacteria bacterium]
LKLVGTESNRAAIGARITWKAQGKRYVQQITGGTGYLSQNDPRVLFPLGTTVGPDTFDIRWPSGAFQRVVALARNQTHTIIEADQTAVPVVDGAPPAVLALAQNSPNPFQNDTAIRFALPAAGRVTLEILDVQGRLVRKILDQELANGVWEERWDGRTGDGAPAASGVYFYRLTTPEGSRTRRLILAR